LGDGIGGGYDLDGFGDNGRHSVTTIELVRHAKAHSRDRWWGKPDRERPLTTAGIHQSRALARDLRADGPIAALYSSPYLRCVQTLEPISNAVGLPVLVDEALAEVTALPPLDGGDGWTASAWLGGRALAFTESVLDKHGDERVVACTHGDVAPALVAALVGRDGLVVPTVRLRKGARFTLTFDGRRCIAVAPTAAPEDRMPS
jgi:8-oxo-(d)GTP phosphatase